MFGGLIVRLAISEGETATKSGQMSIPKNIGARWAFYNAPAAIIAGGLPATPEKDDPAGSVH